MMMGKSKFFGVALFVIGATSSQVAPLQVQPRVEPLTDYSVCFIDGLWYGTDPVNNDLVTVGMKSLLGPPGVRSASSFYDKAAKPRSRRHMSAREWHNLYLESTDGTLNFDMYAAIEGAAIGCGAIGNTCLLDPTGKYGCEQIISGGISQCVWVTGPEPAQVGCELWDECQGFWCGKAADIPQSNSSWCWARSNASKLLFTADFALDTAYVKPHPFGPDVISAACSNNDCKWIDASGVWLGSSNNVLTLSRNDGVTYKGKLGPANCSVIEWDSGHTWTKLNENISKVHIVWMAHLDVGYTIPTVKELLQAYVEQYFPTAWTTSETLRKNGGDAVFQWTSHAWLIQALLQNQSGVASPAFITKLKASIANDDIKYHAGPMNMQQEAGEIKHMTFGMEISKQLDKQFGKKTKITASQKDCPGVSLGMLDMFDDVGVKLLHIGVNDFSTAPAWPSLSASYHGYCNPGILASNATASEIMLLFCSGYSGPFELGLQLPNMMTLIPGFDEALVYLMHVDNRGPQTADEAVAGWMATQRIFPNAKLESTSMDAWFEAYTNRNQAPENALPIIKDVEMGDTWIYGLPSDPTKMRQYRVITREVTRQIEAGTIDQSDPNFINFYYTLLKIAEHTWGYNGAGCVSNWSNEEWLDPKFTCHYGGPQFISAANSYYDQREYIQRSIDLLNQTSPLISRLNSLIKAREPLAPMTQVPSGYAPFSIASPVKFDQGSLRFNQSGAITSLVLLGNTFANSTHPLGLFTYRTHSEVELNRFGDQYALQQCASACGRCGTSKCGLDKSGGLSSRSPAVVTGSWKKDVNSTCVSFLFNLTFANYSDGMFLTKFGAPAFATLVVTLGTSATVTGNLSIDFDLQWNDKRPTRMAESLWMTFAPVSKQTGWQMNKLGRWVDPLQVVTNGSKTMHAIWQGVRSPAAGVTIESPDAPVVSPGVDLDPHGLFNEVPHPEQGWSFNLFNNAWSTNYPLWSLDPSERFQWTMKLVTPS